MNIILIGMNHKTAPLALRERLCLSWEQEKNPLEEIVNIPQVKEALYLSTCNRVEVLANIAGDDAERRLKDFMLRQGNLSLEEMKQCVYAHRNLEAVRHLFRVASSIDSLVMGEPQILGQVKEAYRRAVEFGSTSVVLNKLLHQAFKAAKRVRTETAIGANPVSVSFAAVTLAKKIFGDLRGKTILLVGAGEMSELAARQLGSYGADKIIIANRTYSRAEEMARDFNGEAVGFDKLNEALLKADIVITSTGAPGYIITSAMIDQAVGGRKSRHLFLIDIAVPRDVEPQAGERENVFLYNIDNLQDMVDENFTKRAAEAKKAEVIIEEELIKYQTWLGSLQVVPTINSLREKLEGIMNNELQRFSCLKERLGEDNQRQLEHLIMSIINKILHDPVVALKEESQEDASALYIAATRRLFKLDE